MSYATLPDLITRYGEVELLRLVTPEGQDLGAIDQVRVQSALDDASAEMDSYLRRRYLTPVNPVSRELVLCCCILARYELAHGESRQPTDQMVEARKDRIRWLEAVRDGKNFLPDATPSGSQSEAQAQTGSDARVCVRGGGDWPGPDDWWRHV